MIVNIEDHLIQEIKGLFGNRLKTVDSLPGDWDANMLRSLIITAPAVYLAFTGGPKLREADTVVGIDGRWAMFSITNHASGHAARRRGDGLQIGSYEIMQRLAPKFHNHVVPDVGSMKLVNIENLYSGVLNGQGVAIYSVLFGLPMYFEHGFDAADLDAFETFHLDFDLAPPNGAIEGQTDIELPQP